MTSVTELNAAIRQLNDHELDRIAGGEAISTVVNTAANAVAATAKLVENVAAAYLTGVAEYEHHLT